MSSPIIAISQLTRRYGRVDAVDGLDLHVEPGRCYGFFGRNGAGKTTTIKCLLNLLRPTAGSVRVFGLDPAREEVKVKSRLAYVPDAVAFYPWMTVRDTLDYFAAFRSRWNRHTEGALLHQFGLDARQKTSHLSKGQRTQLALITAICPEPELLVLDEPTSRLDPIVRREFIQTIIGAYQEGDPGRRTVFVSTHLISEFEGLIDEFTIIDRGRAVLTMGADTARERFQKVYARFSTDAPPFHLRGCRVGRAEGREIEIIVDGSACRAEEAVAVLRALSPEELTAEALTLEEIFVTTLQPEQPGPMKAVAWTLGPFARTAMKKELRALAPGWVACLALLVAADVMDTGWSRTSRVSFLLLGPAALGALSMGHEYSNGTLSLLLSQPGRRERMWLVKLGALASMLLTLPLAQFVLGVGSAEEQVLVLALPLMCGLFIAPWFTMLCRSSLAGMVFTVATPAGIMVAAEIASGMRVAADPALTAGAAAFKTAALSWGTLITSVVAAVFGWRLFMRLEAIDGRGQGFHLRSSAAGVQPGKSIPLFAKRNPLWLLMKKELRLQQLTFAVGVLYVLGWVAIWSGSSANPYLSTSLLFALTGLNGLAAAVLAGSVASAEERHMGTLEWHALLPMSARLQWMVKVGVTVGVALTLGLALPMALAAASGSREIQDGVRPFVNPGASFTLIFLSVMSLYVSSRCATSLQALLLSIAAALGLMTLARSWSVVGMQLGISAGVNPFAFLRWWTGGWWRNTEVREFTLLILMTALPVLLYSGAIGLLLQYAHANHRSAERSSRHLARQLLSLATFFVIVVLPMTGVSRMLDAEARANQRAFMQRRYGLLTIAAVDTGNKPLTNFAVVVIPEDRSRYKGLLVFGVDPQTFPAGRLETHLVPGQYSIVAVEPPRWQHDRLARQDPELIGRLKAQSIPLTIAAGESKTLHMTLSRY